MKLTIFTPTYNRASTIKRVYDSLCKQKYQKFEWLLINDGSTDNTDEVVTNIISNHKDEFKIRYYKQLNKGLNRTINKAIDLAQGELFCRLDSDDYATENLVELIMMHYDLIKNDNNLCALVFLSQKPNGLLNGTHPFNEIKRTNFNEYRDKYGAKGDRSEVVKTSIYRKYKFPEIQGENFITESIVWTRMGKDYDAIYINEPIYVKGEGADTITSNIYCTNKRCSKGVSMFFYEAMTSNCFSLKFRLIHAIKYYRYAFLAKANIFKGIPFYLVLIGLPIGLLVILHDKLKFKND